MDGYALLTDVSATAVRVAESANAIDEGCHPTTTNARIRAAGMNFRDLFIRNAA